MDRLLRAALKPTARDGTGACPDASLLSAFVEGELTATERAALDAHFAGCDRCQEALAIVSHDLPQESLDEPLAPQESRWFTWVTRPRLRWLVPVSAVATVAVVFFATRPLIAPEWDSQRAEVPKLARAPATPTETAAAGGGALRENAAPVPEKDEFAAAPGELPARGARAPDRKPAEAVAGTMAARVASEEKAAAPAAPPPAAPAEGQLAAAPQAANAAVAADAVSKEPAAGKARAAPVAGAPAMRAQEQEAPLLIASAPGGSVMWTFGAGGRISRSGDAGTTWHEQTSGVTADLLAGAAPSSATCWIVGAAGTVLVTMDGERWERRPFPEAVDLVAVSASGSRAAVVTARDGRRFETRDAGLTWSPKQ
jgi:Putative zinc-finger